MAIPFDTRNFVTLTFHRGPPKAVGDEREGFSESQGQEIGRFTSRVVCVCVWVCGGVCVGVCGCVYEIVFFPHSLLDVSHMLCLANVLICQATVKAHKSTHMHAHTHTRTHTHLYTACVCVLIAVSVSTLSLSLSLSL